MFAKLLIAAAVALGPAAAAREPAASSVYIIRHLQKATGDNPSLTPEGRAGARTLADHLADKGIKAVFATATKRAQETGKPLADRLKLTITSYDPRSPQSLMPLVKNAGGPVLIIGHSNTVPELVAQFGGERPAPLTEQDYGVLFVVEPAAKAVRQINLDDLR